MSNSAADCSVASIDAVPSDCEGVVDLRAPEVVLTAALDRRAREMGSKVFLWYGDDVRWTYQEMRELALRTAAGFANLGVKRGDRVLVWIPTTPDCVRIQMGLAYLGAVFVPINTALKGMTLEHIVVNSAASLIVCHGQLATRLNSISLGKLSDLVLLEGMLDAPIMLRVHPRDSLKGDPSTLVLPSIRPSDVHAIFYTSGTTGPSKGVLCTHIHTLVIGLAAMRFLTPEDRWLINLPYYHIGAAFAPFGIVALGASMAMLKEYRTQTFWSDVEKVQATTCVLLGSIATFLMRQPTVVGENKTTLRAVLQQPLLPEAVAFAKRFNVQVFTQHDMTEIPAVLASDSIGGSDMPVGYCGRLTHIGARYQIRLVDEYDCTVPDGQVGEYVLRCDTPWVLAPGYNEMPEATAHVWRNGWFHTGDLFRRDVSGNYYFVDRLKDYIRRRGENISSVELEAEALRYDAIADAAAVAVKSDLGEDDVLLVVEPKPGHVIDPPDLIRFLIERAPYYLVPRYVRTVDHMPYTDTNKIHKVSLRQQGINVEGVWDRDAVGISVKRDRIN